MARWSRSRLRSFGIGASVFLGGSLLVAPLDSPVVAAPPTVPSGLLPVVAEGGDRSAFRYTDVSGGTDKPIGFVSTGGTVRAQPFGENAKSALKAKTGAPVAAGKTATTAAATYRTTIQIDSPNWTAWNKTIHLWNRDTWAYITVDNPGSSLTATADLPPGNYFVGAMYGIYNVDSYLLTKAFTVTGKAQTVVLAQSSAKEVALKVDDATARIDASAVWLSLPNGDLIGFAGGYNDTRTYVTTASTAGTTLRTHQILTKKGATALQPSPYRYDLAQSWAHPFPSSLISTSKTAALAKTTTTVRAQGINTPGSYQSVTMFGEWTGVYLPTQMRLPATFVEYVTPGVTFSRFVQYGSSQHLDLGDRNLPAGPSTSTTAGAGPLRPSRRTWNDDSERRGNQLRILENMPYGDSAGNRGYDYDAKVAVELSADGRALGTSSNGGLMVDVPAGEQTYRLKQRHDRIVAGSQLATKVESDWTFVSGGSMQGTLDLMDLAVSSTGLDQRNRAGLAPVSLTVVPSSRRTAGAAGTVRTIEWSTDDGATWTNLPLTASGAGVTTSLTVPAAAAFVSLRITADNDRGGKLTRTVQRAFAGPATGADEQTGGVTVSNVTFQSGSVLNVGTSGTTSVTATFTASAPSGIADGGLFLWHGAYDTPDGVQLAGTSCTPVNATTANCSATLYFWDVRHLFSSNALAGMWRASAWATAKDGAGHAHRHSAGTLLIKRAVGLATADATPEPVKKGNTITISGTLTRADWATGAYAPYAGTVTLQWLKPGTKTWTRVKSVRSDANGRIKTTVTATADGYYRFVYTGDVVSSGAVGGWDYIDVR
ncbi:hypothetical protein [Actinoplanes italicus]|uniref:Uncharacterized protein n=1 Tax=Actinoplanes italicus TaxID=113567 RepID=A0A2T0JGF3_9ACTN|nr:hypothetical protein [Actinoplanes italicus]PRX06664.1 hypothetical protein CLV67_14343 [Actinoplanes italicus]